MVVSPFGINEEGENLPNGNGSFNFEIPGVQNNNGENPFLRNQIKFVTKSTFEDGKNYNNVDFSAYKSQLPILCGPRKQIKRNNIDIKEFQDKSKRVFKEQKTSNLHGYPVLETSLAVQNFQQNNDNNKENTTVLRSKLKECDTGNIVEPFDLPIVDENYLKLFEKDTNVSTPCLDVLYTDDPLKLINSPLKLDDNNPHISKAVKQSKKTRINKLDRIPTRSNPKRKVRRDNCYCEIDEENIGTNTMSIYDYNYHSSDGGGSSSSNVNKYMTSKGHHSISDDAYHNNDTSSRQQLYDIATSMASLSNIGNSCYMNSVIYTLRFTPLFLHNLHHLIHDFSQIINKKECQTKLKSSSLGRNVSGLQGQNARSWSSKDLVSLGSSSSSSSSPAFDVTKTTQQIAIEKMHELFQNLSNNEMAESIEPYHSDLFLRAIQDVSPIFEGNQQQDAHEFLMCILDSVRETCQSLTKIVTEHPELIANGFVLLYFIIINACFFFFYKLISI